MRTLTTILLTFFIGTAFAAAAFSDVPSASLHADAIAYVQEHGIVNGYPDGTYRPDDTINRAEFVKILIEATGGIVELPRCKIAPFSDVEYSSWYASYVLEAQCRGVVGGYPDRTFHPAASISLAEAAKIIVEAMDYDYVESEQSWYRGYTEVLAAHHALPKDLGGVSAPITRGIMAEIIYRLKTGKTDLSSYTADDVEEMHTMASSSFSVYSGLLPLGDKKYSSSPKKGYIYSCQTSFNGSGAFRDGEWIQGSMWNPSTKPVVDGSNLWSNATFSIETQGDTRMITGNALPLHEPTGNYPISSTDDAYQYDRNPNSIKTQTISLALARTPALATSPSCVPMGIIGVAVNGVAIFNGFDAEGRDAAAHEILDGCQGHPQQQGMYHYHAGSTCLGDTNADGQSPLLGYALDGFGIYGKYDENGRELTSDDLDECHGRTSVVEWEGKNVSMYHYVITRDYPYSIGCFRGTPVSNGGQGNDAGGAMQPQTGAKQTGGGGNGPPQEAIAACTGKQINGSCSFSTPHGTMTGTCRNTPDGSVACVP